MGAEPGDGRSRRRVAVTGVVQGVGFRPYVYTLARGLGLAGSVANCAGGVDIAVEGDARAVEEFCHRVGEEAPALATVTSVSWSAEPARGDQDFRIRSSLSAPGRDRTLAPADCGICDDCLADLTDPANRRYRHPFVTCTNCGPRFTNIRDLPYDRATTTMAGFAMCADCAREYADPGDRRFHAETISCPGCGPRLSLVTSGGLAVADAGGLAAARRLLAAGAVLAVKGLGGYHLAVDAASETAAAALRARKHREDKPFAVMAADLAAAARLGQVDETAARLLTSTRRPIVLLPRLPAADVAPAVAPGNRQLGVMLPYTPLHHLLLRETGRPIVLTSGNVSDEPIVYADDEAAERLSPIADAWLTHNRPIETRTDDSVTRSFRGREMVIRRSRGYVPEPLEVAARFPRPVLACGAELKNTFCLARDSHAFVSHHIGDLENAETLRSFTDGIRHFRRLFGITPQVVAHDLHPDYLSTKYATDLAERGIDGGPGPGEVELAGVQHHHAHIASCLADNRASGPVIGVAFDGTGYGTDGTIWGGEFLIADTARFERAGHLATVPMPGGAAAIRQPWRMAAAYLGAQSALDVARRNERHWPAVVAMAQRGINSPLTSSAGRLFDAVAAILGVRDAINYEGQAAVELEQLADPAEPGAYHATITVEDTTLEDAVEDAVPAPPLRIAGIDLVRAVAEDLAAGTDRSLIAARFHNGVAGLICDCCRLLRERHGLGAVALSGGVFQNLLLLHATVARLEDHGFEVLVHSRVPCNDGGISLGQAVVAASSS
jgi:hydrogenase maturation protein HypF